MTGIVRPHLGDADRATSVAAAGVRLPGLAFGDPGKFLQAGGHVLVQVSAQVVHPGQCSQAEVQENRDRPEHLIAKLGGGAAGPWSEEPADGAAAGFGAGEGELLAPLGGLHDWLGQAAQRRLLRALNRAPGTASAAPSSQRHEMTSGLHSGVRGTSETRS